MEIKQIWMSPDTARKSRYGLRTLGGSAAIAALAMLLVCGGAFLSLTLDLPRETFLLLLVCAVTALTAAMALKLGWRAARDATLFFLTEDDRLFVLDARALSRSGRGVPGFASGAVRTQKFLRELAKQPRLPAGAMEILGVEDLHETGTYYAVRCRAVRPGCRAVRLTCFLVKGCEDEASLLLQLERRRSWEGTLEPADSRTPLCLLVSVLALAASTTLCVLSHPAVGWLPQGVYFACLGAAFLTFFFVVYFIIRLRRGE